MVAHGGVGCLCGWSQSECDEKIPEILTPIGLVPHPRIGMVWAAHPSGKQSKSLEKVISRAPLENLPGLPGDGGYFLHARFLKFGDRRKWPQFGHLSDAAYGAYKYWGNLLGQKKWGQFRLSPNYPELPLSANFIPLHSRRPE
jgi:hypothetical protein